MGFLRLLLALIVCADHYLGALRLPLPRFLGLGADMAVEVFFIISGFYMGLILTRRYEGPGRAAAFYKSRFFRLFPVYWATLACYFAALGLFRVWSGRWAHLPEWFHAVSGLDLFSQAWAVFSNLFLFGGNLLFFFSIAEPSSLFGAFSPALPPSWIVLFVPHAWSIEMELGFYLLAPWLVGVRARWLVPAVLACLAGKLWLENVGLVNDSWYLRNPVLDLGLFALGVLAHRVYAGVYARDLDRGLRWGFAAAFLLALLFYHKDSAHWIFPLGVHLCAFLGVPALFAITRSSRADRLVGELSYPIYLCHQMVFYLVALTAGFRHVVPLSLAATLAFSALMHATLGRAVDRYRHGKY
ncbi:hypothetical protein NNJEOMEG_03134 [Fundidesulfovibrio magnetotacticus]|uniref:Acyltransferase 3 domain-containing protein n=1 Tax=Fundidesulfovibrio magnetotacticus TaxID=2730080 RepID=A0A6V8M4D1_9BACT|nr:acyltransferase [Fundidesulfovibrio magnetotacticus]GFK95275.1 hypothetical protein NNJEOMEG_03134 [Fundidesulfovibrio magnetotacticus]